jgi:hypothetical protein
MAGFKTRNNDLRDADIRALFKEGVSREDLQDEFGLSYGRIVQILSYNS